MSISEYELFEVMTSSEKGQTEKIESKEAENGAKS